MLGLMMGRSVWDGRFCRFWRSGERCWIYAGSWIDSVVGARLCDCEKEREMTDSYRD